MKVSILYFSKTGKTKTMAEEMLKGMSEVAGIEAKAFSIEDADAEYVNESKAVVFGTPTYYANMAWQMKKWFDEDSAKGGFKLAGKLGAAYATANVPQGGADIANITMVQHMLVKGMLAYSGGTALGQPFLHVGACGWRDTFEGDKEFFRIYGKRIAEKTSELFSK